MGSGPGEDRKDESTHRQRKGRRQRWRVTERDDAGLAFKNINICAPLRSHIRPEVKNAEVGRQMYQTDQVKTQHAAQTGALNCSNGLFLLM